MLVVCEHVGGFPYRSDEVHAPISPQFLDLGDFQLNLSSIRLVGACLHV